MDLWTVAFGGGDLTEISPELRGCPTPRSGEPRRSTNPQIFKIWKLFFGKVPRHFLSSPGLYSSIRHFRIIQKMAVSSATSGLIATTVSILLLGGMQIFKTQLASTQLGTVFGGFLGSQLFVLLLTAVSNFEMSTFGDGFQARVFPEILFTLLAALFVAGSVHRVCVTTCLLFSLVSLYYLNKMSTVSYGASSQSHSQGLNKKKKF